MSGAPEVPYRPDSTRSAVVSDAIEWQPMRTCPPHMRCQLRNASGMPCYGSWDGKDPQWTGWFPIPKDPAWLREGRTE